MFWQEIHLRGNKKGPCGPRWLRHPPPNDRINYIMHKCFSNVKHFFNRSRRDDFCNRPLQNWGHLQKGEACCPDDRGGKSATACGKIGCQLIVQQLVAQITSGRFLHLLIDKPVGISGYVTRLTESLLPMGARRQVRKSSRDYCPVQRRSKLN